MKNILFVCSANKQRSATADHYFSEKYTELNFDSAGTNHKICRKEGTTPLEEEHLIWADLVVVMESKHKAIIKKNTGSKYSSKIKIANIQDVFKYYQKELIVELEEKVDPMLRG